jgi:hypothetical protein
MTYKITLNETQVVVHESIVGPQGATGAAGTSGIVSATDPITYNSTTKDVGFNETGFVKTAIANTFTTGAQIIQTGADAIKGLIIKRNSVSQSANLLSVVQSDGTTEIARIRPNGQLGVGSLITNALLGINQDQVADNRGIVIKAGVTSPVNNAIEILPSASNTPNLSVTHGGRIGTEGDIFTNGDLTVNGATGISVANNITATGSATVTNLTASNGLATLGTVSNSAKIGIIDLFNGSSGGKSRILPAVGTSATITNYCPTSNGTIATTADITSANLSASQIASGTLDTARIPSTINGTTIPASSTLLTSTALRQSQLAASGTIDVIPRMQVGTTRGLTAGTIYFTGFVPVADVTVTKISTVVTATTATSLQYAIFSVSANTLTMIAATAVGTSPAVGLSELSFSSAPTLTAGNTYAIAFLSVGASSTIAGTAILQNAVLSGLGTSGVLTPLIGAASSSTSYTAMPAVSSTVALSGTAAATIGYARLN